MYRIIRGRIFKNNEDSSPCKNLLQRVSERQLRASILRTMLMANSSVPWRSQWGSI